MAVKVASGQYYDIDGQLLEIKRQLRQSTGYSFDPNQLKEFLQLAVEGKFTEIVDPAVSKFIHRTVPVVRTLSPEAALLATSRTQYVNDSVVANMPKGAGDSAIMAFILLENWLDEKTVDQLLGDHGLVAADPFALAALNATEPYFANEHKCFTHWQNAKGEWCCAAFSIWDDERGVFVHQRTGDNGWGDGWWVAGVRKP